MKKTLATVLISGIALAGCAPTGEYLQSDVFGANQLNTRQEVKPVTILAVLPAKVRINNSDEKQIAQTAGTLLGAVVGGIVGYQYSGAGAAAGAVAGGTTGALAGSMIKSTVLVPGVSISYRVQGTNQVYNSTQAGQPCQFHRGQALMITGMGNSNETRIQPNAICPKK
ncbi:hypothetical protein A6A19_04810 [Actinobacillus delphinicola]|uniref:17 kDa surface antigen n=1 Tax=Actinobacillus delphinicola TaxID=51161 RepID=A0A448TTL7_9PAST|nr:hypothetical protein [Actinobacillus delphinicola]MDG6897328.1 hypothetical protein [Actinobacillus delphinicola]VEJ09151.1 Uncharacterised protein [Actinobacillus delphinicola]